MASPTLIVPPSGPVTAHCIRLRPGDRLMPSLKQVASIILDRIPPQRCGAAFVITAVGSLQDVTLRLANASRTDEGADEGNDIKRFEHQRFEIVSLTGTFGRDGGCHVHISLADAKGHAVGGHLIDGTVFTTCELVLGTAEGVAFSRTMDDETGYNELEVRQLLPRTEGSGWRRAWVAALAAAAAGVLAARLRSR